MQYQYLTRSKIISIAFPTKFPMGGNFPSVASYKALLLLLTFGLLSLLQILKEDPNYPEALIGRGTAYAFQRELDAAIADFTKVLIMLLSSVAL